MTRNEIKKLVERLNHYYVSRADCRIAAELIEALYLGERYKHPKRGSSYTLTPTQVRFNTTSKRQDLWNGPWDGEFLVLYRGDDGVFSVRHPNEFHDGRFVKIGEDDEAA